MTTQEQLEFAARAMRLTLNTDGTNFWKSDEFGQSLRYWNPLTDQADSDNMAIKLRLSTVFKVDQRFGDLRVTVSSTEDGIKPLFAHQRVFPGAEINNMNFNIIAQGVREARLAVAAEIGRRMK